MNLHRLFELCLILFATSCFAQNPNDTGGTHNTQIRVINGDTALYKKMPDLNIFATPTPVFKSANDEWKYWRLVRNVKKVYPYAKIAKQKVDDMNAHFLTLKTDREKKEYSRQVEKELRAQFEQQLKDLTTSQGAILIKLIDRETGESSYELVKEMRGSVTAAFGQALARIFGLNMKTKYNKEGDDKTIESIIQAIDSGIY